MERKVDIDELLGTGYSRWQALAELLVLSFAMFVGAFGAGMLPLGFSMNQNQLKLVNAVAAGLLLGTALAIIIPEGIHLLFHSESESENHSESHEHSDEKNLVGPVLLFGFIFMLLVDTVTCCGGLHAHSHSQGAVETGDMQSEEEMFELENLSREEKTRSIAIHKTKKRTTVTLGLIVHSFVDGMAVGVAKTASEKTSIEVLIFFAIMVHKIPAAFGLSVYLKSSGLGSSSIRKNLLLFALSAPIGAVTWFLLLHDGFLEVGAIGEGTTGLCMLFSAGTFLYVATIHILGDIHHNNSTLTTKESILICLGAIIPMLLSAGHHH